MATVLLTNEALREQVLKLSVSERLLLVEEIWNSIAIEGAQCSLSESQQAELDQRLKHWRANRSEGLSLEAWRQKHFGAS